MRAAAANRRLRRDLRSRGAITSRFLRDLELQLGFLDERGRIVFLARNGGADADTDTHVAKHRGARMMDPQLAYAQSHPGANAIRLPPSMRAVTSLARRKHPDTQCATRRIVESPAARPNVAL